MRLIYRAPAHHVLELRDLNLTVKGGKLFDVEDEERCLELLTDPAMNVEEAPPESLKRLTREQLDEIAKSYDVDPTDYSNKESLLEALEELQPTAAAEGEGHDNNDPDKEN